jgi:hypothetical protein
MTDRGRSGADSRDGRANSAPLPIPNLAVGSNPPIVHLDTMSFPALDIAGSGSGLGGVDVTVIDVAVRPRRGDPDGPSCRGEAEALHAHPWRQRREGPWEQEPTAAQ